MYRERFIHPLTSYISLGIRAISVYTLTFLSQDVSYGWDSRLTQNDCPPSSQHALNWQRVSQQRKHNVDTNIFLARWSSWRRGPGWGETELSKEFLEEARLIKEEQAPGVLPRLSLKGHRGQEGAGWFSGTLGLWADPTISHRSSTSAFAGLFVIKKEQDIIDIQRDINFRCATYWYICIYFKIITPISLANICYHT